VDDAFLMRVLHGLAYRDEQVQPVARRQLVLIAVVRDGNATDEFHDEVRPAGVGRPGIQHPRNVRMIHERERLPLGRERAITRGCHARLDDFERDLALHWFLLLGDEHEAEAAFADLLLELVWPDHRTGPFGDRRLVDSAIVVLAEAGEKIRIALVHVQKGTNALRECVIAATGMLNEDARSSADSMRRAALKMASSSS